MKLLQVIILLLAPILALSQENEEQFAIPNSQVVEIHDEGLQRDYELFIKLPSSYNSENSQDRVFPVVYLTDAMTAFPLASAATQTAMNSGRMSAAILVGVSWQRGISPIDSRVRDYTPTKQENWERDTGGAADHLRFFENYVFPYVESNFRAAPDRRIYSGHSLGALFAAYVLTNKPETFYGYILGSPSLWYDDKLVLRQTAELEMTEDLEAAKIFLGVGSLESPEFSGAANDLLEDARSYYSLFSSLGKGSSTLQLHVVPEAIHETAYPATIAQGLHWILGN